MYLELMTLSIFGYLGSLKTEFSRESGSEKAEDLPVAMDCTTLTLMDAVQGESASLQDAARTLLAENQNCGVEPRDCHGGTCSTTPVAQSCGEFGGESRIGLLARVLE